MARARDSRRSGNRAQSIRIFKETPFAYDPWTVRSSDLPPKLLFVDDEPGIRLTLSAILERNGFQVTVAATVAEALALISAQKYDILISDLNIGLPSDGFTVV